MGYRFVNAESVCLLSVRAINCTRIRNGSGPHGVGNGVG
jgi:hypothetical protein